jgi:hypothetical protein
MNETESLIARFVAQQGWNDDSVIRLLTSFIHTRQSYWPHGMLADLESFLDNVASEENSWPK